MSDTWTPDQCRAKRWNAWPQYDGAHESHLFYYGEHGRYTGHCGGKQEDDVPQNTSLHAVWERQNGIKS